MCPTYVLKSSFKATGCGEGGATANYSKWAFDISTDSTVSAVDGNFHVAEL